MLPMNLNKQEAAAGQEWLGFSAAVSDALEDAYQPLVSSLSYLWALLNVTAPKKGSYGVVLSKGDVERRA